MTGILLNSLACATCVPNGDAKLSAAANSAILVMLIMLTFVLGSIFSFIMCMRRRAIASAADAQTK